jgi:hypothetical protein
MKEEEERQFAAVCCNEENNNALLGSKRYIMMDTKQTRKLYLQEFAQKISNGQGAQITVVPALMYLFY